ncbi:MAG: PD40 domain-containing protein [Kiritimatiellae bacterium]|nr:PD40 domain-containing protein [Kiritimatiellia bacterium]
MTISLRTLAAAALVALVALSAPAQINISKAAGAKIGVSVSDVRASASPAAATVARVLRQDLERSGFFQIVTPDRASVRVGGPVAETGGRVSFQCTALDGANRTLLSRAYLQTPQNAVYAAHAAADDLVAAITGKKSFFMARLALIGVQGNTKKVYIADSSMQDVRPITQNNAICLKPRWSPDNAKLVYTSYLRRFPDVYTYDLATGRIAVAAAYPGVNSGGAISPDGRFMALILSKDGNPDLYVKDLSSGALTRLTATRTAVEGSPSWSPDSSRLVYVSDSSGSPQLYVISRTGGQPTRLTTTGSQNVAPDWGKNGLIAYQSLQGQFQIAVIDPASRQSRVITPFDAAYEDPSWAPDGRHIAAARSVRYQSSIYLLDTEGDKPVALSASGDWRAPAWSH